MLRIKNKSLHYASLKLLTITITILINIFFFLLCPALYPDSSIIQYLYNPKIGVAYIFIANLAANSIITIFLWKTIKAFRFQFRWKRIKDIYLYGYSFAISNIAFCINEMIDRPMLRYLLPDNFYNGISELDALGIYSACYKLSIFITISIQAIKITLEPLFFKQENSKNSYKTFAELARYSIIIYSLIAIFVVLNLELIGSILIPNPIYRDGLIVVPILLLANVFLGIYYNFSIWFKLSNKTYYGAILSIIGSLITILFNFLLIPHLGYLGSAITTMLCYLFMALLSYLWGKKHMKIPYSKAIVMYIVLIISVIILKYFLLTELDITFFSILLNNAILFLIMVIIFIIERVHYYKNKDNILL